MFIRPVQVPVQISVARLIFKETPTIQTTPHKKQVTETNVSVTLFCRRGRKPVSVIIPIIYLRNLPPDIGRAALICQYIWFCRPWYHTRPASLTDVVSSYLTFSPSPSGIGRQLFSVTVSKDYSHLRFPQQGALSCPDFPH